MSALVTTHDGTAATTVSNANQLDTVLRAASEEARTRGILAAVVIQAENGSSMTMVVGGDETALTFDYGHHNPPYYASKGASKNDEPVLTSTSRSSTTPSFHARASFPITME
jgi:hypothetical protein